MLNRYGRAGQSPLTPANRRLLATGDFSHRVGVSRKRIRGWVRRRLLTPATAPNGCYLWREDDVPVAIRVRDEYRARLGRLAAAVGRNDPAPSG